MAPFGPRPFVAQRRRTLRRALQALVVSEGAPASATPAASETPAASDTPANRATPADRGDEFAAVLPGIPLRFPDDHGAHPRYRTEWWYVTGWLDRGPRGPAGFQATFFRARTTHPEANPSRFAPRQLVLAHAALALPERGRLVHAQRSAREGFGLAGTRTGDTDVWIGTGTRRWSMRRDPAADRYRVAIASDDFGLDLELAPDGPPLLQGDAGFSRKGPRPAQASYYYSRPQLAVRGRWRVDRRTADAAGRAWFDHEWSSEILDERASGWDWVGLNLDDGTALMAFRIRARDGTELWRDATVRDPSGRATTGLAPRFEPLRTWRSTRTGATYPVSMRVDVAGRSMELRPLLDDQELDSRASTGTVYWEGAVTVHAGGTRIGAGYLELTGYAGAVRF